MACKKAVAKTRKSVSKRFKITGTGKVMRQKPGRRHLLAKKSRKRKLRLGKVVAVHVADAKNVKANMPFA